MQAMILAAGEGRRMQPLTLTTPKPLLKVAGQSLIEYQLNRLAAAGIQRCIINIAYLGEQIRQALGDGDRYGLAITYSEEPYPLETAGAIARALPLLDDAPFILVNADVWLEYPLQNLMARRHAVADGHLVLVENPPHNPNGDFSLNQTGLVELAQGDPSSYTFSGLSLLHPKLVRDYPKRREAFPLVEVLRHSIAQGRLSGEVFQGRWMDIGTPDRLHELESYLLGS
jgi:MurNAc alpha-1-phosphate uridylyltransferase